MNYLGIDPGKNGALFLIKENGQIESFVFPKIGLDIDLHQLWRIFDSIPPNTYAALEAVHSIHGTSAKSNFEFGGTFFMLQAFLVAKGVPFKLVRPKEWQKLMHLGITPIKKPGSNSNDTKAMSLQAFKNHFPNFQATASPKATKFHEGMVDAGLIAWYGRKAWQ